MNWLKKLTVALSGGSSPHAPPVALIVQPSRQILLPAGSTKFRATLLGDESSSIASSGLVEPLCGVFDATVQSLASSPGSLARVVLFNGDVRVLTGRDRSHTGDVTSQFVPAEEVARRSIAKDYRASGTTYLERYLCREAQVLLRSFESDSAGEFTHVMFMFTDGRDEAPQEFKRAAQIREYMQQIVAHANRCGGVKQSRIVAFYVGIGLTEAEHRVIAADLGYPPEWVHHVPATREAVDNLSQTVSHTVMDMGRGGQTVMNWPRAQRHGSDSGRLTPVT